MAGLAADGGQGTGRGRAELQPRAWGREGASWGDLGGPTRAGFALQKGDLQFRSPTWGTLCFPSLTWTQEILGRRLLLGWGGSTRRDVTPLLPFPGTSEGDKKAEKSPTDDKVAIILTLHPKGPCPWSSMGRGCRDLPAGVPRGCPRPLWDPKPLFTPPPEQEATARDSWWLPAVSLFCGTLSLQSPGER